jgi:hypothetical protein
MKRKIFVDLLLSSGHKAQFFFDLRDVFYIAVKTTLKAIIIVLTILLENWNMGKFHIVLFSKVLRSL